MSKALKKRLNMIKSYMHKMGQLALAAIIDGVESFVKLDQKLCKRVIKDDQKLIKIDDKIETACIRTIALHQPVAADLRKLSTYLKVITDLRRIGRYGYDIALLTKRMKGLKHFKKLITIPEISRITIQMTQNALHALLSEDSEPLQTLLADDEMVDALMEELFREVITYTIENPKRITVSMQYILAARYLERASDHAVSIGYRTYYSITGRRKLKKTPEKMARAEKDT